MENQEALQADSYVVSPQATPELKLQSHNLDHHDVSTDLSFSSGDESFENSLKEGTKLSSLSPDSPDSQLEFFTSAMNSYLDTVKQMNGLVQQQNESKPVVEPLCLNLSSEEMDCDDSAKGSEHGSTEELIGKILQYEGELGVLNLKLQKSEEQVTMLKNALNRSDNAAHDLKVQLGATKTELERKNANLEEAKGKILHLESQMHELEIRTADSHYNSEMLMKELRKAQENLERSNEDAAMLTARLDIGTQELLELQERISMYQKDASDQEDEIVRLQSALSEAEAKHCVEKEQLIMQWELQCKQLEENFRQRQDEMKELHHALVQDMQDQVSDSKVAVEERETQIDRLNKELDVLKLGHDMVVAEKDGLNARIQALIAELSSRDNHIKKLTAETASAHEVASMLKSRVQVLEDEVEMQRLLISDAAEKKREAIRQLCFSLEHYRMGYHELREAFRSHNKRRAVLAS